MAKMRELRRRSDEGDGAAMNGFGMMLHFYSRGIHRLDERQQEELRRLAGGLTDKDWFQKGAIAGRPEGLRFLCSYANDVSAPAELRQQGQEACEQAAKK